MYYIIVYYIIYEKVIVIYNVLLILYNMARDEDNHWYHVFMVEVNLLAISSSDVWCGVSL